MNEQQDTGLKWLSLDAIHAHCHIDFNCEDAELEQMGITAEQAILDLTRRTYENFIDTYGRIPDPPQFWYTTTCARRCVRVA